MKKTFTLSIISTIFLAMIFAFSSCKEESSEKEYELGGNALVDKYVKDAENVVGTLHYDKDIYEWYVVDENHIFYFFLRAASPRPIVDIEEGQQVKFSGKLFSVSNEWLKKHEQYSQYKETGLYSFAIDAKGSTYSVLN